MTVPGQPPTGCWGLQMQGGAAQQRAPCSPLLCTAHSGACMRQNSEPSTAKRGICWPINPCTRTACTHQYQHRTLPTPAQSTALEARPSRAWHLCGCAAAPAPAPAVWLWGGLQGQAQYTFRTSAPLKVGNLVDTCTRMQGHDHVVRSGAPQHPQRPCPARLLQLPHLTPDRPLCIHSHSSGSRWHAASCSAEQQRTLGAQLVKDNAKPVHTIASG